MNPIETACGYYAENDWDTFVMNQELCDFIAKKGAKIHFVKAVTDENIDSIYVLNNNFVQNAFSNKALPIHARIFQTPKGVKIKCNDINAGTRVMIVKKKIKEVVGKDPTNAPAGPPVGAKNNPTKTRKESAKGKTRTKTRPSRAK